MGSRFLFGHGRYLFACALCHFLVMLYSQPSFLFMEILVEKSLFIQAHFTYCVVFYSLYLLAKSHFGVHKCQVFHSARLYLSPKIPSSMALISNRQSFFKHKISNRLRRTHEVPCAWNGNDLGQNYLFRLAGHFF